MRFDFVITELNVGGAEKTLTELAIGACQREHQVRVLSVGSAPEGDQTQLVDRLTAAGVRVEFGGFDHWSRLLSAAAWLRGRFRDSRPDLCQSFLFHANCLAAQAASHTGVGRLVGGLRVAESKPFRLALERRAVRQMDHLVCVSQRVKSFAIERLAADPENCSVIPNGVDLECYAAAEPFDWTKIGWPADSRVAVFVGRFHRQKGLELIQRQWDQLTGGDPSRRLLLIGRGPLEDPLRRWADQVGRERVQVLAWQPNIARFLRSAKLLILPSHYEGMPNVVLEAMAAGCPVVCSRVEGSEELLGDVERSFGDQRSLRQGFDPGDGQAMARLVDVFLDDDELCRRIGAANQQHVKHSFSNQRMLERYLALYESLV